MIAEGTGVTNLQRLRHLHRLGLLDSPAEPAFDRLTRLVTRLLRVPVALVTLVDAERQFFKSSIGLPDTWASRRQTPLSHSFCQYVVATGEPFIVEDALHHPLVCTNLAIPELQVRAYLGMPLTTGDGLVPGSLCAIDTRPRTWQPDDIELMRDLTAAAIAEIELRRERLARQQVEAALFESNAQFAGAFYHASIGMALVAPDGRWLQVNRALCELVGYAEHELLTLTFQDLTHPDDLGSDLAYAEQLLRGDIATYQMDKRYFHKDGHLIWAVLNASLVRDLHGAPQYCVAQIQDSTRRNQHEWERQQLIAQLSEALNERDTLLDQSIANLKRTEGLYQLAEALNRAHDRLALLHIVVESAARVLPADRTVLIAVDMLAQTVLDQVEGGSGARHVPQLTFTELWDGLSGVVLRDGAPVLSLKGQPDSRESRAVQQRRHDDQAGSVIVAPIQSQGKLLGTLTAINAPDARDFTPDDMALLATLANQAAVAIERISFLAELNYRATMDGLTQLLNRQAWFEQCQYAVALAVRTGRPLSIIVFDIDYFKRVNDTYGHSTGDMVLQMVGQRLRQTIRRSDIAGRYGGEEFVLLLPETDATGACSTAERVRAAIASQPVHIDDLDLSITVSLGVATTQAVDANLTTLVSRADHALYAAKRAGRNCVRLFIKKSDD